MSSFNSEFEEQEEDDHETDVIDLEEEENIEISDKESDVELTEAIMFNCDMCNENYSDKSNFMEHFEVVHQVVKPRINNTEGLCDLKPKKIESKKNVNCQLCNKSYKAKKYLRVHMKRKHQEPIKIVEPQPKKFKSQENSLKERKVQCLVCECYFFNQSSLTKHQKRFREKSCKDAQSYKQKLQEKAEIEGDKENKIEKLPCEVCNKVYGSKGSLVVHMKREHKAFYQETRNKKAEIESQVFKEVPIVEDNYFRDNETSNTLICKLCNKSSARIDGSTQSQAQFANMKNHLMKKHKIVISKNALKQKCNLCELDFSSYAKLSVHVDESHKVDEKYKCDKCEGIYDSKNDWYHHTYTIHSTQMKWFDKTEFPCSECDAVFDTYTKTYKHKIKVHREEVPIDCDKCGKVYKSKTALKSHMRIMHHVYVIKDEQKVKKCDQCDIEFKEANEFDEHLRSLHKCDKDFQCKDCDLTWVSHLSLELHYIESHQKILFSCDICGYTSINAAIVRKHRTSIHERNENCKCDDCGESFHKKSLLIDHLGEVHNDGEWRFNCDYCGKRFMNKTAVNIHVEDNHAINLQ